MKRMFRSSILLAAALAVEPAFAHTGAQALFSLQSGLAHPMLGLDHVLAMFAVGLLAAQIGGRALWHVPAAFVATMLIGALAGYAGVPMPAAEHFIALSVAAIALPVAFALGMPAALAMAYVGLFAVFHGYAHGAELPAGGHAARYFLGFALATAFIHAAGIAAGLACMRISALRSGRGLRLAGGVLAIAGIGLMVG